jgi:polysaccharide export outer membrane protein
VFTKLSRWLQITTSVLASIVLEGSVVRAAEEYKLAPGDTIEVIIAGLPELQRKAQIGADGGVTLPLAGRVQISGLTLPKAQDIIQQSLSTQAFRQRGAGGETVSAIRAEDVSVDVAQYAPVYIDGAITRPGELPFRPLMTVRQAIALSGGYDPFQGRGMSSPLEALDLENESERLANEIGRLELEIGRLKAEVEGVPELPPLAKLVSKQPAGSLEEIYNVERERLSTNRANLLAEKKASAVQLESIQNQISELIQQRKAQERGLELQEAELTEVRGYYERRVAPLSRVNEAQRDVSLALDRLQQTKAQISLTERARHEFQRLPTKLDEQRRTQLLNELQQASSKLQDAKARLEGVVGKLDAAGSGLPQLRRRGQSPTITIFRGTEKETDRIEATEDMVLLPRDLIEVGFQQRNPSPVNPSVPQVPPSPSKTSRLPPSFESSGPPSQHGETKGSQK